MTRRRRFTVDAAHKLRSPFTALSVQAENVLQAGSLETMKEPVKPLQVGIECARQLTEQPPYLSLARAQAGTAEETVIDIPVMVRELIGQFLPRSEAKKIDFGPDERARFSLRTPPQLMHLILGNAWDHALQYTPAGSEGPVRLLAEGETAVIEIVYSGPGIPHGERGWSFDAFYRVPGSTVTGSGLGLTITRETASRLGGVLTLRTRKRGPGLDLKYPQQRES